MSGTNEVRFDPCMYILPHKTNKKPQGNKEVLTYSTIISSVTVGTDLVFGAGVESLPDKTCVKRFHLVSSVRDGQSELRHTFDHGLDISRCCHKKARRTRISGRYQGAMNLLRYNHKIALLATLGALFAWAVQI